MIITIQSSGDATVTIDTSEPVEMFDLTDTPALSAEEAELIRDGFLPPVETKRESR